MRSGGKVPLEIAALGQEGGRGRGGAEHMLMKTFVPPSSLVFTQNLLPGEVTDMQLVW